MSQKPLTRNDTPLYLKNRKTAVKNVYGSFPAVYKKLETRYKKQEGEAPAAPILQPTCRWSSVSWFVVGLKPMCVNRSYLKITATGCPDISSARLRPTTKVERTQQLIELFHIKNILIWLLNQSLQNPALLRPDTLSTPLWHFQDQETSFRSLLCSLLINGCSHTGDICL